MKVIFLNLYQEKISRGAENILSNLIETLPKEIDVTILHSGSFAVASPQTSTQDNINLFSRLFLTHKRLFELLFTLRCLSTIIREKPDILIPVNGGWQVLICRFYCSFTKTKLIITGHSGPGWDDRWNLLMRPDAFVCLTSSQCRWAQSASIWQQNLTVIPNAIDTKTFKPGGSTIKLSISHPRILCVAATSESKRIIATVKAVSKLKNVSLLLVGNGELDSAVNSLASSLLPGRFLHRTYSVKQMPAVYRSCDLFTLYSDSTEAFGIVYLEAMASGLGCVATDDPSRREIVGPAGLYTNSEEDYPKKIAEALKTNWRTLALTQSAKYSLENMSASYAKLFTDLVHE